MTTKDNSENLIEKVGGIEKAREVVEGAPELSTDYVFWTDKTRYINRLTKEVYLDGTHEWFSANIMVLNLMHCLDDLRTAIAENDREFKVGDLVVSTWGLEKRVLKIVLKPKFKNGILYLTLLIDGVKRECLAQWWRQATNEEIALGFRS